ncbi:MAG: tetratricopeptide repeat protein [Candidatus Melainabacteria bacterium]|jgi:tetratricopeptide (TPR) repeat protein|nr:tetratricopeptide repeat protein [Candidatus Melainabacteria bacterium]
MMVTEWEKYKDSAEQLVQMGRYSEAENFWMLAVKAADDFQANDPRTTYTLDRLGDCFIKQQRFAEAEQVFGMALEIRKQVLGHTHLDVGKSLSQIVDLMQIEGKHNEAEPLQLEILSIYEVNFGAEHPGVATIVLNLAQFYHGLKRYNEAELFYKRALAIKQKLYGYRSPEVKGLTEKYAAMLQECDRAQEAESLVEEVQGTASGVWRAINAKREEEVKSKGDKMKRSGFFDRFKKDR